MLREVKAEIAALVMNLTFARNLSLTMIIAIAGLWGLAELQSQNVLLNEHNFITHVSNSSSTRVIVEHK